MLLQKMLSERYWYLARYSQRLKQAKIALVQVWTAVKETTLANLITDCTCD